MDCNTLLFDGPQREKKTMSDTTQWCLMTELLFHAYWENSFIFNYVALMHEK